jgi:hypothetical protein
VPLRVNSCLLKPVSRSAGHVGAVAYTLCYAQERLVEACGSHRRTCGWCKCCASDTQLRGPSARFTRAKTQGMACVLCKDASHGDASHVFIVARVLLSMVRPQRVVQHLQQESPQCFAPTTDSGDSAARHRLSLCRNPVGHTYSER